MLTKFYRLSKRRWRVENSPKSRPSQNCGGLLFLFSHDFFNELTLVSIVSIDTAQGSEFPVMVMSFNQRYTMLQRNLLYTAITRTRKLCVLAGSPRAISMAVRNNKVAHRFTALEWRLAEK